MKKSKLINLAANLLETGAEKCLELASRVVNADMPPEVPKPKPVTMPRPYNETVEGELMDDDPDLEEFREELIAIPAEVHLVRTEVARQIEAAFGSIVWKENGEEAIEVIVTRVYPVHIAGTNTYTCMVGVARKEVMTEETAIPLHQFLQVFAPVDAIDFGEYQA